MKTSHCYRVLGYNALKKSVLRFPQFHIYATLATDCTVPAQPSLSTSSSFIFAGCLSYLHSCSSIHTTSSFHMIILKPYIPSRPSGSYQSFVQIFYPPSLKHHSCSCPCSSTAYFSPSLFSLFGPELWKSPLASLWSLLTQVTQPSSSYESNN